MNINKIAVITGAAGGIGKEISMCLSSLGYTLCLVDKKSEIHNLTNINVKLNKNHKILICDLSSESEVLKTVREIVNFFGKVDLLINNAGIMHPNPFITSSYSDIKEQINVNVLGTILFTRAILPALLEAKGHIFILSSLAGIVPAPYHSVYVSTKFALRGFGLTLHLELKKQGVRVTTILPGTINSPMTQRMAERLSSPMAYINPALSPTLVSKAITNSLNKNKIEIYIPHSQGLLARVATVFPSMIPFLYPILEKKGIKNKRLWYQSESNS